MNTGRTDLFAYPAALAAFDISEVRQDPKFNPLWAAFDAPASVTGHEVYCTSSGWALDHLRWYTTAVMEIAQRPLGEYDSPAERMTAMHAKRFMLTDGTTMLDPVLGRPTNIWSAMAPTWSFMIATKFVPEDLGGKPWHKPGQGLEIIEARMELLPTDCANARDVWLGDQSVGWTGEMERRKTLQAYDGVVSDGTRRKVRQIWIDQGGDTTRFDDELWPRFVKRMGTVRALWSDTPADREVRLGASAYETTFAQLGMNIDIETLYRLAQEWYPQIEAEADRLAQIGGFQGWRDAVEKYDFQDPTGPRWIEDDEDLLVRYTQAWQQRRTLFVELGLLDWDVPEAFTLKVQHTEPAQRAQLPTAALWGGEFVRDPYAKRVATMSATPFEELPAGERELRQRHQSLAASITAGHEWVHFLQAARSPFIGPPLWRRTALSLVGMEGLAFVSELFGDSHFMEGIIKLVDWLKRLARVMAEYEIHVLELDTEQVVSNYHSRTDLGRTDAEADVARAFFDIMLFSSYAIGAWGIFAAAEQHFDGDLERTWREYLHETGGCVAIQTWLVARELIEGEDDFTWQPSRCWPVEMMQNQFPKLS